MERLTFNVGGRGSAAAVAEPSRARAPRPAAAVADVAPRKARRERLTADYMWTLLFTTVLFFRPQDQVRPLSLLHLAELSAVAGLAAMAARRAGAGQTILKVTPDLAGIMALGGVILITTPFSIWPGGSVHLFSDIYVKIILIFALLTNTLNSTKRIQQITTLMIVASGYLAASACFDYVRGVNLVEDGRVRGAVGGMFSNPNDLALNLVTFLGPTLLIIAYERRPARRVFAAGVAALMFAAIVFTKSRGGFLGLIAVLLVVAMYTVRVRPGVLVASVCVGVLALPALPSSFWARMNSILVAREDPTGSREARIRLMRQGLDVFMHKPLTGIGAGQFKNYQGPEVTERWRETHDVWLQVAAEMVVAGLAAFLFLVFRAFGACRTTLKMLRPPRRRRAPLVAGTRTRGAPALALTDAERTSIALNARSMLVALIGWSVCACFASVAYNWTFYYVFALAVAGREFVVSRQTVTEPEAAPAVTRLVGVPA